MAQPSHISYPESKTHAKELAVAQANVYKVPFETHTISIDFYMNSLKKNNWRFYRQVFIFISDNARMLESGTIQASNLWVPNAYVWRFQYHDSKSVHGVTSRNEN